MKKQLLWVGLVALCGVGCADGAEQVDDAVSAGVEVSAADCASYDSYLASLAELTLQCRGTLDPRDFVVAADGAIRPTFTSCRSDGLKLTKIRQLLSLQERTNQLPHVKQCVGGRIAAAQRDLDARGIDSCPTWEKTRVVNPIDLATTSLVERALPTLPAQHGELSRVPVRGISRASLTSLEATRDVSGQLAESIGAFDLLEENSIYGVSGALQSCGTAAECATACASAFPGFVVGAKSASSVVTDPVAWLLDTTYKSKSQDPFLRATYYHPMSYYGPLPGVMFADYARYEPCGPNNTDPLCGPEQCSYYAGNHLRTFLQKDCLDDSNVETCVAYCGPKL